MKYSLSWRSDNWKQADEVVCPANQLGFILKDIQPNQRLVIVRARTDIDDIMKYIPENIDYTIRCTDIWTYKLVSRNYKAYIDAPVTDWETFHIYQELGVTDIRIDGPLCFCGEALSKARESGVKIRAKIGFYGFERANRKLTPNTFFIRPEDISIYEDAIDIIEFPDEDKKGEVLFRIYTEMGCFTDNLNILYGRFDGYDDIRNTLFSDIFALRRYNCKQRCLDPAASPCHYCFTEFNIVKSIPVLGERKEPND